MKEQIKIENKILIYPNRINLLLTFFLISASSAAVNLYFYSNLNSFHLIYSAGFLFLFLGYFFISIVLSKNKNQETTIKFKSHKEIISLYKTLSWIGVALIIYILNKYGLGLTSSENIIENMRYAKTIHRLNFFGVGHFGLISLILSIILKIQGQKKQSIIYFLIALSASVASAERTSILHSFILYFGTDLLLTKKASLTKVLIPTIALFSLFIIIASFTNKLFDSNDQIFILSYFGFPLEAISNLNLESVVLPQSSVFGIAATPFDELFSKIISTPDDAGLFNVYSYIYKPLTILGIEGFLILMFFLGVIFSLIEIQSRKSIPFLGLKLSLLFSVVLSFYDWTFNLTTHIYVFFLFFLALGKYNIYGRHNHSQLERRPSNQNLC